MKKIEANSPEAQSSNIVASNIDQLKALFSELVTEGAGGVAVNVDVLKALVGDKLSPTPTKNTASTGTASVAPANWR